MSACGNLTQDEEALYANIWEHNLQSNKAALASGEEISEPSGDESSEASGDESSDPSGNGGTSVQTTASTESQTTTLTTTILTDTFTTSDTSGSKTTTKTVTGTTTSKTNGTTRKTASGTADTARTGTVTNTNATSRQTNTVSAVQTTPKPQVKWYSASELAAVLNNAIDSYSAEVTLNGKADQATLNSAYQTVTADRLDLFWLNGVSLRTSGDRSTVVLSLKNGYNIQTAKTMHSKLMTTVDSVVKNARNRSDNYDKVLYVHDYIVNTCKYNSGADSSANGAYSYACLVQGNAGSMGYSEAFAIIMRKLGYECGICNGTTTGKYSWNYIRYNGSYYWIDCAGDDPGNSSTLEHDFFMVDNTFLFRSRTVDRSANSFIPNCNSMKDNYYARKGQYYSRFDFKSVNALFNKALKDGEKSVTIIFSGMDESNSFMDDFHASVSKFDSIKQNLYYEPETVKDSYKCGFKTVFTLTKFR